MNRITAYIEEKKAEIINFGEVLLSCPELGYKEEKSGQFVANAWSDLGFDVKRIGLTGCKTRLKGNHGKISVCLLSELDAVISPDNLIACKSGEAHACGHSVQSTQVYAAMQALLKLQNELDGDVVFMAVPAEEFLDIEYRLSLKKKGLIKSISGKQELIRRGDFDDVDMVIMLHSQPNCPDYKFFVSPDSLGFTAKTIKFIGKEAHGAAPFNGINALAAANLALTGINANRETFRDEDKLRIHPIITKGGDIVNTVPSDVRIETYIRGADSQAILKGCKVVDRCVRAGAMMMGASFCIETIPGYLPLNNDKTLGVLSEDVASDILGKDAIVRGASMVGSTDFGDLTYILPGIQPTMGGFWGDAHSKDFNVVDYWTSYKLGGEILAKMVYELLKNGAIKAHEVKEKYHPIMTKNEYISNLDKQEEEYVG